MRLWSMLLLGVMTIRGGPLSTAEKLIECGHWKQARQIVEARLREAPEDALSNYLLSQIRGAFGDRSTPLALAERAVARDGSSAKYHRQVAEVIGVMAQHSGPFQQLLLARRFRREIDLALRLDPHDVQAHRDLLEFYLLAPGILGGDRRRAADVAGQIAVLDAVEGLVAQARIAAFEGQAAAQEDLLRRAAESPSAKYSVRLALAAFCLESGHRNLAIAEAQAHAAIAIDSGRADAYAVLASVFADRSDWSGLEATLATSRREVPDDLLPYYSAAVWLLNADREPARAERYLRIYLAQEPEGNRPTAAEARLQLGKALEAQSQGARSRRAASNQTGAQ